MWEWVAWLHYGVKTFKYWPNETFEVQKGFRKDRDLLFCLHGFGHNSSCFKGYEETWNVNLVFCNFSFLQHTVKELAECLELWRSTHYGDYRFGFLTHSLGGLVALDHQTRFKRAEVMICIAPPLNGSLWAPTLKDLNPENLRAFRVAAKRAIVIEAESDQVVRELGREFEFQEHYVIDAKHVNILCHEQTLRIVNLKIRMKQV